MRQHILVAMRSRQVVAMGHRWGAIVLVLLGLGLTRGAAADQPSVRIIRSADLAALPLIVVEHQHLIEKQAQARGLGAVTVEWQTAVTGNALDALYSGNTDFVAILDLVTFVTAWDERSGTPQELRALTSLARMPYLLLSRNAAIATIRDFTQKDRIAVPAPKNSLPAVLLEMAAAQEWGAAHFDRLDALAVARSDDAADDALHTGKGDIDTHFVRLPLSDDERADPAVHRVMDSFDIAGPHNVAVLATLSPFRDANPALCAAIAAAIGEADDFITHNRGAAAEIYDSTIKGQDIPVEVLSDMLGDPDLGYQPGPEGTVRLTGFLHQIGRLNHSPDSWQQLFFPEIYRLGGS
jgi:NitT/TauT family transport system substrate-binding protein